MNSPTEDQYVPKLISCNPLYDPYWSKTKLPNKHIKEKWGQIWQLNYGSYSTANPFSFALYFLNELWKNQCVRAGMKLQ